MDFKALDLVKYYFKNYVLAGIVLILALVLGSIYITNFFEKEYVAKTTVMLGVCDHDCSEEDHLNVNFNKAVVNDYIELIKSNVVLNNAIVNANEKYTVGELKSMLNVYYSDDTEYITIEITSNKKDDTENLRYSIYESLQNEVSRIFDINNVHLVDNDATGSLKYSQSFLFLIVFILSLGLSFVVTTIKFLFFPNLEFRNIWNSFFDKVVGFKNNITDKVEKKVSKLNEGAKKEKGCCFFK